MVQAHGWQVGVELLAVGFSYYPSKPLPRADGLCLQQGFPMSDQERAKRKYNVFYVLILELMLYYFHSILLVTWVGPIQCGRGLRKERIMNGSNPGPQGG